jgi:hypothetical protein
MSMSNSDFKSKVMTRYIMIFQMVRTTIKKVESIITRSQCNPVAGNMVSQKYCQNW